MRKFFLLCVLALSSLQAEEVVWSGTVDSDGTPTVPVHLDLHSKYVLRVSGFVNLGKWIQNREKLGYDACYEYSNEGEMEKVITFRNSSDISVCNGKYHPNHVYTSAPFESKQNKIHFWIYDADYDDNNGELKVEVLKVLDEKSLIAK